MLQSMPSRLRRFSASSASNSRQRALEQAWGLKRLDDLAQVSVESKEARLEVINPAENDRLRGSIFERVGELPTEEPDLAQQRENVLRRTVVHVECQTREPPLGGLHDDSEPVLVRTEKIGSLERIRDDWFGLASQHVCEVTTARRPTKHDRADGALTACDRNALDCSMNPQLLLRSDHFLRMLSGPASHGMLASRPDAAHSIAQLDGPDRDRVEVRDELERLYLPTNCFLVREREQAEIPQGQRSHDQTGHTLVGAKFHEVSESCFDCTVGAHIRCGLRFRCVVHRY